MKLGLKVSDKIKMSVKSFDQLRELIANPPKPNVNLVKAVENYKSNSSTDADGVTTINLADN